MHTRWSSIVIAVVLAGCASKAPPQTSNASPPAPQPTAPAVTTAAPVATQAPVVASAKPAPRVETPKATKLAVKRIAIAHGIAGREPQGASDTFDAKTDKVYAFVELENPQRLPGEITVEFQPPSKKYEGAITLGVGESSRFRTWAFTRQAHEAGEWTAIVRDARGRELAREKFDVTG